MQTGCVTCDSTKDLSPFQFTLYFFFYKKKSPLLYLEFYIYIIIVENCKSNFNNHKFPKEFTF